MNEEIRGFYLKNEGGFVARIRCNGTVYNDICIGQGQTLDLATDVGVKDGDVVYFEVVVAGGNNKTIKERFIYRLASEKRACYTISGTTLINKLSYNGTERYFDKTMYAYIKNYPKDRENGWSEEVNGVSHDESNWFFTQNGNLWKFPVTHNLNDTCKSANPLKGILEHVTSFHLGDLDYYRGYLFVPVTGTGSIKGTISHEVLKTEYDRTVDESNRNIGKPQIFIFKANDLSYVRSVSIRKKDGNFFDSLGWLAINPRNGLLYTSDNTVSNKFDGKKAPIHVYSIGSINDNEMLKLHSTLVLADEYSRLLELSCMQGGCFDNDNYLHLSCGFVTNYKGLDPRKKDLDKFRDGISVFKVSQNPTKGNTNTAIRVAHSGQSGNFAFQFDGTGDEPEGITYWDIDKARIELSNKLNIAKSLIAPNIEGQLHAIMLNNLGTGDDDLYFKHYRRISGYQPSSPKPIETPPETPESSMTIRYISLKNNGGFAVCIRVKGGSESFESSSFPVGQERTVDLADALGKIKDGDMVWLEAVVKGGKNKTGGERFIYKKESNKKARYSIKGTTLSNSLSFIGIE